MQAWWTFPRVDNFGLIDPAGPYWKPDSNIQLPGYYPVTAILPGTVTNVQVTQWGQHVVTVKLDQPLNNLATHTFYEHMSADGVQVGQHLNAGDLIGYNNPSGGVPLGFGLYPGDVYGSGPGWGILQNDLKPGGAGLLNPVALLNGFAQSNTYQPDYGNYTGGGVTAGGSSTGGGGFDFQGFAVKAGLFLLALAFIALGLYLLFKPQIDAKMKQGGHAAVKLAELAAL